MSGRGLSSSRTICGCWYVLYGHYEKQYLPLVDLQSHTTILATTSRTKLTQTFHNPQTKDKLDEVKYTFPLYDGVSVVNFRCTVAGRTIIGVVKEKQQARTDYQAAVDRGETAGLLEQVPDSSDAFTTTIGNIPANEQVVVEIEYLGDLKHDAETDGSRFTIPTIIAPRYGPTPPDSHNSVSTHGISISVDVAVEDGSVIRGIQSPSHPIAVTMGRISTTIDEESFDNNHASATLTLGSAVLEKDFVIVVLAKGQDTPRALLETHPTIPNQRALMTTLVPKFNLPSIHPEIVFVVDRSGSMGGKIPTLIAALKVFLKSLPVGVKFNICSFGNSHKFMFKQSRSYDQSSLKEALRHVSTFGADMGGTEIYGAVKATFKNRLPGIPLEVLVLTDGQIWDQQTLFDYINTSCAEKGTLARVFSLGIGSGASSSLVEGIARAGDGFAQFVDDNEKMDKRVVRMLKGALSPHIKDYKLEVKYSKPDDVDDDFEIIESVEIGISKLVIDTPKAPSPIKKVISLFDTSTKETPTNPSVGRYDHLPTITPPAIMQAPHNIPTLYSFNRTTIYLLLSPSACQKTPSSVILRATSEHGPLELEIPVQDVGKGQTIHQLAAKKAVHELEQGRGWLSGNTFKNKLKGSTHESRSEELIEREAVRLGVQFQVGGKFCSFVAVEDGVEKEQVPPAYSPESSEEAETRSRAVRKKSIVGGGSVTFGRMVTHAAAPAANVMCKEKRGRARQAPSGSIGGLAPSGAGLFGAPAQSAPSATYFAAASTTPAAQHSSIGSSAGFGASMYGGPPPTSPRQARMSPSQPEYRRQSYSIGHDVSGEQFSYDAELVGAQKSSSTSIFGSTPGSHQGGFGSQQQHQTHHELSEKVRKSKCATPASPPPPPPHSATISDEDKVRELIDLNNFDGSWSMSVRLEQIVGMKNFVWKRAGWSELATVTAMVIAFLETKMKSEKDVWDMVVEKARGWLAGSVGDQDAGEALQEVKGLF